jgi:hypothetical protein
MNSTPFFLTLEDLNWSMLHPNCIDVSNKAS